MYYISLISGERKRAELAEQERQAAEEAKRAAEQRMADQQKSYEENIAQLKEKVRSRQIIKT